ncbi:hypothetical protein CYMTET_34794, partial [Cymbomonas tetramitiformis]
MLRNDSIGAGPRVPGGLRSLAYNLESYCQWQRGEARGRQWQLRVGGSVVRQGERLVAAVAVAKVGAVLCAQGERLVAAVAVASGGSVVRSVGEGRGSWRQWQLRVGAGCSAQGERLRAWAVAAAVGGERFVAAMAFVGDGGIHFITVGADNNHTIAVWNCEGGRLLFRSKGYMGSPPQIDGWDWPFSARQVYGVACNPFSVGEFVTFGHKHIKIWRPNSERTTADKWSSRAGVFNSHPVHVGPPSSRRPPVSGPCTLVPLALAALLS